MTTNPSSSESTGLKATEDHNCSGESSSSPGERFAKTTHRIQPGSKSTSKPAGYSPKQIQHAYEFDKLIKRGITGKEQNIAIVVAFHYPTAKKDLKIFSKQFGLPRAKLNHCRRVITLVFIVPEPVATSTSRDRAFRLLKMALIDSYFDYVLCGNEIENSKPNPEIFLKVAEKLDCRPENCLVLEDSEVGVVAAFRAGMLPIMIPDMKVPNEEVRKLAFRHMSTLLEVKMFLEDMYIG